MARAFVTSGSPGLGKAPEAEYQEETIFDWIRRQNNPKKRNAPVAADASRPTLKKGE